MKSKIIAFLLLIVILTFSGCSGYEISTKLVSDAIVLTPDKLCLITDTAQKPQIYQVDYDKLNTSLKEIKKKYDLNPFLSHSKEIIISAEVTVKELSELISQLKDNNEIPPDTKITLSETKPLEMIRKGEVSSQEIYTLIKNSNICDERICSYNSYLTGDKFTMLYENDGEVKVKQITI